MQTIPYQKSDTPRTPSWCRPTLIAGLATLVLVIIVAFATRSSEPPPLEIFLFVLFALLTVVPFSVMDSRATARERKSLRDSVEAVYGPVIMLPHPTEEQERFVTPDARLYAVMMSRDAPDVLFLKELN